MNFGGWCLKGANYSAFFSTRPCVSAISNDFPPWVTPNSFISRCCCFHFDQIGKFGCDSASRLRWHERYDGKGIGSICGRGDDFVKLESAPADSNDAGSICCAAVSKPVERNDLDVLAVGIDRCSLRRLPPPCSSFATMAAP